MGELSDPQIHTNATMYPEAGARRGVYFNPQHAYMHTSQKLGRDPEEVGS